MSKLFHRTFMSHAMNKSAIVSLLGTRTRTPLTPFALARVWQKRQCSWSGELGGLLHVVVVVPLFLVSSRQLNHHRELLLEHLFCVTHDVVCVCVYIQVAQKKSSQALFHGVLPAALFWRKSAKSSMVTCTWNDSSFASTWRHSRRKATKMRSTLSIATSSSRRRHVTDKIDL